MDLGFRVVYHVYALSTRDLANSLRHISLSPAKGSIMWINLLKCSIALPFLPSKWWNFGGSYPLGYGFQRALVEIGDLEKIAWGFSRIFPFSAPKGHWHLLALDIGGWLHLLLLTLPLVGLWPSWPQGGRYPWFLRSYPLWGGESLVANLSAFLPFKPQGLAPILRAYVLIWPLVLPEVPCSSVWKPLHFLLQA